MTDHLTKEEFKQFKDNHFTHLAKDVVDLKIGQGRQWEVLKGHGKLLWWIMGIVAAILVATVVK